MIDIDKIERLAKAAPAGKWEIHTSNSWRRIYANQGREQVRVIEPGVQPYDSHPDLMFGRGVPEYLEGVPPEAVLALVAEVRRLKSENHAFTTACGEMNEEVVALRAYADRYQWLRAQPNDTTAPRIDVVQWSEMDESANEGRGLRMEELDAAIDAARGSK